MVNDKFEKLGYINLSNRRFKTVIYGRQKSADLDLDEMGKFADMDANSQSVTTLIFSSHLI